MDVRRIPRVVCGAVLASALCLCGCADVRTYFDQHVGLTTADSYLSEWRATSSPKVSAAATKREGVLTVGLRSSQSSPLVFTEGDEVSGLDVDVACALADELGLRVGFVNVVDVHAALAGPCDIVMGVGTQEANGFDVVGDYVESATALFRHGADASQATAEQVRAARIAVQEGSAAQLTLRQMHAGASEVPTPSLTDAFDALARGEADFVACNPAPGMYVCTLRGGMSLAGTLDAPTAVGVAVTSGEGELSSALTTAYAQIQGNGVLASLRSPWLGSGVPLLPGAQIPNVATPAEVVTPAEAPQPSEQVEAGANAVAI